LAALVFGQLLEEGMFSSVLALFGVGLWVLFVGMAVLFAAGDES
jgi:hypothetical protein